MDAGTGRVLETFTVPRPADNGWVIAYDNWLIIEETSGKNGYRLAATDLGTGETTTVVSEKAGHTLHGLDMCDADRLCVLDQAPLRRYTLASIDLTRQREVWRVPAMEGYPMVESDGHGRTMVADTGVMAFYDANGREVLRTKEAATSWLNTETLLNVPAAPGPVQLIRFSDGHVTTLGEVPLRIGNCVNTEDRLACPTLDGLRIWSLTG
jgi:hypothetical protein